MFERLRGDPLLKGFTLVGGTALTLQIGHRISEDLDFNLIGTRLPVRRVAALIENLEREGIPVSSLIPDEKKVSFRINAGRSLDNHIQDYAVGGTKMTFHARTTDDRPKIQIEALKDAARAQWDGGEGFDILGVDGLFAMKTLVLFDRSRSRDIFDLMVLTRDCGYTLAEMEKIAKELQPARDRDFERCKGVLTGQIPLDPDDEGFESIRLDCTVEEMYGYFTERVDEYEREIVEQMLSQADGG